MEHIRDRKFKEKFIEVLERKGYAAKETTDEFCFYDVVAYKNGMECRFELKFRNFCSTKYSDHMFEQYKYDRLESERENYKDAYLVSYYLDNKVRISNVFSANHTNEKRYAPTTTEFGNNEYKEKDMVIYDEFREFDMTVRI